MGGSYCRPFQVPSWLPQLGQTQLLHPAVGETQGSGVWNQGSVLGLSSACGRIVCRWKRENGSLTQGSAQARFLLLADPLFCLYPFQPF